MFQYYLLHQWRQVKLLEQILLYPQDNLSLSSVTPPLAGPGGRRPPGM